MWSAAVGLAAAGWGADCVVERAASRPAAPEAAGTDDTLELKWDSGFGLWWLCWYIGSGSRVANDFDITTISTYGVVRAMMFKSRSDWPNVGWDGFRLGIFNFPGGVPGSLIWGPEFVVPRGYSGWHTFYVNWVLPGGTYKFVAAQEQYYDYPVCDPFNIDNNPTFRGHSWMHLRGKWEPFSSSYSDPYRNIMIRVLMATELAVAPTSLGRVKALYY